MKLVVVMKMKVKMRMNGCSAILIVSLVRASSHTKALSISNPYTLVVRCFS